MVTVQGVNPDPAKVQASEDMPIAKDRSDLQRILDLVTYMSRFIPNMSNMTSVLRYLLEKDADLVALHVLQETDGSVDACRMCTTRHDIS